MSPRTGSAPYDCAGRSVPKPDPTCYIERSKVREILIGSDVIDNDSTDILLVEVDRLPIFVAPDFRELPQTPSNQAVADALNLLSDLFSETAHETWTKGEVAEVIEDFIKLREGKHD